MCAARSKKGSLHLRWVSGFDDAGLICADAQPPWKIPRVAIGPRPGMLTPSQSRRSDCRRELFSGMKVGYSTIPSKDIQQKKIKRASIVPLDGHDQDGRIRLDFLNPFQYLIQIRNNLFVYIEQMNGLGGRP